MKTRNTSILSVLLLMMTLSLLCDAAFCAEGSPESFTNFESAFQSGVKKYQEGKFDESKSALEQAIHFQPQNVSALTNLALAQFQTGNKGWAIALLRKATNLDPDFSTPKAALAFILPQLEVKEIPHEIRLWESLHARFLAPFSLMAFSILAALFSLGTGWSLLSYFGKRKRAKEQDLAFPNFNVLTVIFCAGALAFYALITMKFIDQQSPRATIIAAKVTALSSPDEKAPALFELYPGLEVIWNQSQNDWAQVTYPGGSAGWIPKKSLFLTTETNAEN